MEVQQAQINDQLLREDIQKDGSYSLLQLMRRRTEKKKIKNLNSTGIECKM